MANIYLVRHAESRANMQGVYQGITYDTELSVRGQKQAQALAVRFEDISLSRIITSPLKRTLQTAAVVGNSKKIPPQVEQQIIETNHGDWEGKHKEEIQKIWPWIYKKWQRFPSGTKFPHGEHFLDTQKRVTGWWGQFCQTVLDDTLIVSHDNIIRIIVARVLNKKLNSIWKFHLQPTSVTVVSINHECPSIVRLGDSKHLEGLSVDLSMHAL